MDRGVNIGFSVSILALIVILLELSIIGPYDITNRSPSRGHTDPSIVIELSTEIRSNKPFPNQDKHTLSQELVTGQTMIQRRNKVKEVCQKYGSRLSDFTYQALCPDHSQRLSFKQFLVEKEKTKTVYCPVHKAASTTWLRLLALIENNTKFLNHPIVQERGGYYL